MAEVFSPANPSPTHSALSPDRPTRKDGQRWPLPPSRSVARGGSQSHESGYMTKITRIDNILEATGVEREGDLLAAMKELWVNISKIEQPDYIPVAQWVLDEIESARNGR